MSMKPETQLLKAAHEGRVQISCWLNCCSNKEIKDSFMGFANAEKRLIGAIARYKREQKK